MAILKIKDETGKFVDIPAIQGAPGKDGAIQYTAGEGIKIEGNVISATGGVTLEEVTAITGDPQKLETESKQLVGAINEVLANGGGIEELTDEIVVIKDLEAGIYHITNSVQTIQYGTTSYDMYGRQNAIMIIDEYTSSSSKVKRAYIFREGCITLLDSATSRYRNLKLTDVALTSGNTFTGVNTFDSLPRSSVVPTRDNELVNKKYVDTAITNAITTSLEASY